MLSGVVQTAGAVIRSAAVVPVPRRCTGAGSSDAGSYWASWVRSRSASETTPSGRWSGPTTGTAVMSYSVSRATISRNPVPGLTVTT